MDSKRHRLLNQTDRSVIANFDNCGTLVFKQGVTILDIFLIKQEGKRFVVFKNGERVRLPMDGGSKILAEFDTIEDARKYVDILKSLKNKGMKDRC